MEPSSSAQRLKDARGDLLDRARERGFGGDFTARLACLVDDYFKERLEELDEPLRAVPFSLAAVGGYGRGALCPHSDIDLLLLFAREVPPEAGGLAVHFFHPLWDLGLKVGHGVRSVAECQDLAASDHQVLASLIDLRQVGGDPAPCRALARDLGSRAPSLAPGFALALHQDNQERITRFGRGAGLLEPDLKAGLGGLRDVQQIRWLAGLTSGEVPLGRGGRPLPDPFSPGDWEELDRAEEFLLRARSLLHHLSGRRRDVLFLDFQADAARAMGFEEAGSGQGDSGLSRGLAVERFLSNLHQSMERVRAMREAAFREFFPEIAGASDHREKSALPPGTGLGPGGVGLDDPAAPLSLELVLNLFLACGDTGAPLSWSARSRAAALAREGLPEAEAARGMKVFQGLTAVLPSRHSERALLEMLSTGVLARVLPELGLVQDLVQFDAYHLHPLGEHTVKTVARALSLGEDPRFSEAFERASRAGDLPVLAWGALLHDIGKGGPGHAERGKAMAREILARLEADKDMAEEVAFLVASHLLMPLCAQKADLTDETRVARLAVDIGSRRRLDLLYLLSGADAMATGPKAWNSWNASLLAELHLKLLNLLTAGPVARPHDAARILANRDKVRSLANGRFAAPEVERMLESMDQRYILATYPARIVDHMALLRRMEEMVEQDTARKPRGRGGVGLTVLDWRRRKRAGGFELAFAARNQPGLFAAICGALSLYGLDVRSAEIFTFSGGAILDVFNVSDPPDSLFPEETFARVTRSVRYALSGKLDLDYRLAQKRGSPLARSLVPADPRPPSVTVDNRSSDFFTLVEVQADDRLGLLYDIARAFRALGVSLHVARVGTRVDRAMDIFSVRDDLGRKIEDPERIGLMERELARAASS